jgi:hypothetical protein
LRAVIITKGWSGARLSNCSISCDRRQISILCVPRQREFKFAAERTRTLVISERERENGGGSAARTLITRANICARVAQANEHIKTKVGAAVKVSNR